MDKNGNKLIIGKYYLLDGDIMQYIGMNDIKQTYQFKDKKRNNLIIARIIDYISGLNLPILLNDNEIDTDDEFPNDPYTS